MMLRKRNLAGLSRFDVAKVMEEFQKSEESPLHRNGTFKIDAPFEKALDTILKAKPGKPKPEK